MSGKLRNLPRRPNRNRVDRLLLETLHAHSPLATLEESDRMLLLDLCYHPPGLNNQTTLLFLIFPQPFNDPTYLYIIML